MGFIGTCIRVSNIAPSGGCYEILLWAVIRTPEGTLAGLGKLLERRRNTGFTKTSYNNASISNKRTHAQNAFRDFSVRARFALGGWGLELREQGSGA